jgi:hypothetical protein
LKENKSNSQTVHAGKDLVPFLFVNKEVGFNENQWIWAADFPLLLVSTAAAWLPTPHCAVVDSRDGGKLLVERGHPERRGPSLLVSCPSCSLPPDSRVLDCGHLTPLRLLLPEVWTLLHSPVA